MNRYTFVLPSENQNAFACSAVYDVIQSLKDLVDQIFLQTLKYVDEFSE